LAFEPLTGHQATLAVAGAAELFCLAWKGKPPLLFLEKAWRDGSSVVSKVLPCCLALPQA